MSLSEKKFYPKWEVKVIGNKVVFKDRPGFDNHLIPLDGKDMHLVLKDISKERSRQEEKFYRGVVVPMIADEMCIPQQEAHEIMAKLFLTIEEQSPVGYRFERVQSTTELSDKAYREYWNQCIRWASLSATGEGLTVNSGLSLYIPMPREVDYSNY